MPKLAQCFKCKEFKSPDDFYTHVLMASGKLGKCKECTKADVRANYRKRRDQYREYDRQRQQKPERKLKKLGYQLKSRKRNPLVARARDLVNIHTLSGKLIRPNKCSACTKKCKPEAHHEDYTKPLEVVWLCFKCHRARHGQIAQDLLNK